MSDDDVVYRTATGKELTQADLDELVREAEGGYDIYRLKGSTPARIMAVGVSSRLAVRAAHRARQEKVRLHVVLDAALAQYLGPEEAT